MNDPKLAKNLDRIIKSALLNPFTAEFAFKHPFTVEFAFKQRHGPTQPHDLHECEVNTICINAGKFQMPRLA